MKFIKSSLITKIIILMIAVYATVTLVSLQVKITEKREESATLQEQITETRQENERLTETIQQANTTAGVEEAARDKLGLVTEGEIVFYDIGN